MIKTNLPVILLKGLVLLPNQEVRVELTNPITKKVINISKLYHDDEVLIVCPMDTLEENPDTSDLPDMGVTGKIKSCIDLPNGCTRIVISGIERVKVYNYVNYSNEDDVLESIVSPINIGETDEIEETAVLRKLMNGLDNYIGACSTVSNSIISQVKGIIDLNKLTDIIANFIPLNFEKKIKLMLDANPISRAKYLIREMSIEIAVGELENKLDRDLKQELDDAQKEFILREKIKVIREELGETNSKDVEIENFNKKIKKRGIPKKIEEKLKTEIEKYRITPESSPEISVTRNYIDILLSIPWNKKTTDESSLKRVEEKLNETHYGLEEVKTRVIEYIAVKNNSVSSKTPVICLSGPPGVGKTTFASSIADSLNKEFVKISLGGLNDTSEILGHRRTYIGSNPGKIINALIKSGVKNPVILLDEIDKLTKDFRGDPASALLEVLDTSTNSKFVDNYVDAEVDLSEVLFIVTANDVYNIPPALYDRLEIINISGYTTDEKLMIAENHLIKNALINNGLSSNSIKFDSNAILNIISSYTKENGVRELDRLINKIIRKVITESKKKNVKIKSKKILESDIITYLKTPKYKSETKVINSTGLIKALACTSVGGSIIEIETVLFDGTNEIKTTGSLGSVIGESIQVSLSYIKSNASLFNIKLDSIKNKDVHINFREGATPKDGPSAGCAITSSILSEILGKKVPNDVSMSGEITLKGDILPVGGIKDKLIAGIKEGIKICYLPESNKPDVNELDDKIKNKIKIKFVSKYTQIYDDIFKE